MNATQHAEFPWDLVQQERLEGWMSRSTAAQFPFEGIAAPITFIVRFPSG
jgi:hypothetical protein